MKSWLADPDAPRHPDVGGLPLPTTVPSADDLRRAVGILEQQVRAADYAHVVFCVAKLIAGFNERLTATEAKTRARLWQEVIPDVPRDLWSKAAIDLLQTWKRDDHYGRVPEASDVLAAIQEPLARRTTALKRCKAQLTGTSAPAKPAEQPIPTRLGRLMHTRGIYERMGRAIDVERIDREIAVENGTLQKSAIPQTAVSTAPAEPFKPADTPSNRRLAELAAAKREGRAPAEQRDVAEAP